MGPTIEDLESGRAQADLVGDDTAAIMATTTMMLDEDGELSRKGNASRELAPFSPGYLLCDRWQIIERIGKGGFGFVYSALDLELDTKVAIKTLRPEHETRSETVRQFKQEIQLARQVTHKNVCRSSTSASTNRGICVCPSSAWSFSKASPSTTF